MDACLTRIVATVGPSCSSTERLEQLLEAGADVFRFNFSHGTHAEHADRFQRIRALAKARHLPIGMFADLQGPKLRVGNFHEGRAKLAAGAAFRLDSDKTPGDSRRVCLPHPEIFEALDKGAVLLIDDGRIRLEVEQCGDDFAETRVVIGGVISDHKGVNLPNVMLKVSAITEKDRDDLAFALEIGMPMIALSFVQRPADLHEARDLIRGRAKLIAKLEKPSAIEELDAIIEASDAIMVARGDLGVELPAEDVPGLQKRIIEACRRAGRPVIVATQMLESMMSSPAPTRAEASDVANAVYDGADAVMLSGETAAGQYPEEAVTMMSRIIRRTERDPSYRRIVDAVHAAPGTSDSDAITAAARQVAEAIGAKAIVTFTSTGSTTLRAARVRPPVPILALTPENYTASWLSLVWGVTPTVVTQFSRFEELLDEAVRQARAHGLAGPGESIVVTGGLPVGIAGTTNVLQIVHIP